ncbi:hypothetical protein RCH21_003086 [Arthrobacter sp. PL16]|uniref:hypothetical protein n=1 Tax=Arthrobacter sp. PL16 TaxID=3071720 RepID=UPI002DFE2CD8|nr:hypothetical protein [Arthrobacter sp. PL16]
MNADEQRKQLAQIVLEENLDLSLVWLGYFRISGSANEKDFRLYAAGECQLPTPQRDLISLALRQLATGHQEALERQVDRERSQHLHDHGD